MFVAPKNSCFETKHDEHISDDTSGILRLIQLIWPDLGFSCIGLKAFSTVLRRHSLCDCQIV